MKYLPFLTAVIMASCGPSVNNRQVVDTTTKPMQKVASNNASRADTNLAAMEPQPNTTENLDIPANGTYRYDMAFAEFKGASRGEKVTVVIKDNGIKIVYEGDGSMKVAKGTVLNEGLIVKHKSGVYIIAKNPGDAQADVIGGCSGGPNIIDFINKKYNTC